MADTDTTAAAPAADATATATAPAAPAPAAAPAAPAPKASKAAAPAPEVPAETAPAAPEAPAEVWYPLSGPLTAGAYYDNLTGKHAFLKGGECRQVSFADGVDLTGIKTAEEGLALVNTLPRSKYTIRYAAPSADAAPASA